MTAPWKYRPADVEFEDWEDSLLSNIMAWASKKMLPRWCETEDHWTSVVSGYFWADCACCLWFRGLCVGLLVGFVMGLMF